ncbi:hypothetical protein DRQ53_00680 [bacterium]|nr:MAG: hypothetical protein DRQ53_00680 [bacterium]
MPRSAANSSLDLPLSAQRLLMLGSFAAACWLLIPQESWLVGGICWAVSLLLALTDKVEAVPRRMGVLLACVAILAFAPISTDTRPIKFLTLGGSFLAVIVLPAVVLARTDPGVIRYQLWPRRFRWLDLFYVAISFPLALFILDWYFSFNSFMPFQWPMPDQPDPDAMTWLFWGINGVGVWDELFFVNTSFAILRSLFAFRIANPFQAVLYTAVLFDMAFAGIGPVLVYLFALTQGSMFEESENLFYVLVVHLIVDYFLYWEIIAGHYPGYLRTGLFH